MYPSRFRYEAPHSLDEARALLTRFGDEAKILAGGQSLVPLLKLRFAAPELLVDINGIPGLGHHTEDADGTLRIGALCRHVDLERSELLAAKHPLMAAAAPLIADPIVRNRGTLVGSLCHSDPQGDWQSVLLALGGHVVAVGPNGRRTIPAADFAVGPFQNSLLPGEIAVEAVIPAPRGRVAGTYFKLERRVGDFATVGVAIALETSGDAGASDSRVIKAGIALTGVGPSNIQATAAERALVGRPLTEASIEEAAQLAADASRPKSDHRGSAAYKRHIVATFVRRGLGRESAPTEGVAA